MNFFGCFGVHRFYAGKIGTGILYLFTAGGFLIGWMVDLISILSNRFTDGRGCVIRAKQDNRPFGQPRHLPGDDVPLPTTREEAYVVAPQWMKIIQESATICNSTVNPETFFSRYDLMEQYLRRLAAVEHLLSFTGSPPSAELRKVTEKRPDAIHDMIDRSYQRMIQEARELKTPKGQEGRLVKYFSTMEGFSEALGPDGSAYVQSLKERHTVR